MVTAKIGECLMSCCVRGAFAAGLVLAFAPRLAVGQVTPISTHEFLWTAPESGGQIRVQENVYRGCSDGHLNELTFEYVVNNVNYDPIPGVTNGVSGWQLVFPEAIPELHNQQSPAVGGPWDQNCCGEVPPFGAEWDVAGPPNLGIMPGQTGIFSFCTARRPDIVLSSNENEGWAHTWTCEEGCEQAFIFNGPNSVPGGLTAATPAVSSLGMLLLVGALFLIGSLTLAVRQGAVSKGRLTPGN